MCLQTLWQFRECIAEALLRDGYVYKYDISLPLSQFYGLVPEMSDRVRKEGAIRCCGFGHLGKQAHIDSNLKTIFYS
jgi:D-2-hydroxyglutarate dehydrogenase